MKQVTYLIIFILILYHTSLIAQKRSITSEDFYPIKHITECQVSPDGKTIAYVIEQVDRENNRYLSNIWLLSLENDKSVQLTTSLARDRSIYWSPDSRYLVFVSNRSGVNQLWIIPIHGGEAWALTDFPEGAFSPAWSPDGTKIAFLSSVRTMAEQSNLPFFTKDEKQYAKDVKIIRHLKYRYDAKYFDDKYSHIFVIAVNGGEAKQLTDGDFHDSAPAWSPDSKNIVFVSNRTGNKNFDDNSDLFLVPADGGQLRQLTSNPGPDFNPIWSPKGDVIYYLGKSEPNNFAQQYDIYVLNVQSQKSTNITQNFDRNPTNIQISTDRKSLYFLAADRGNVHLYFSKIDKNNHEKVIQGSRQ